MTSRALRTNTTWRPTRVVMMRMKGLVPVPLADDFNDALLDDGAEVLRAPCREQPPRAGTARQFRFAPKVRREGSERCLQRLGANHLGIRRMEFVEILRAAQDHGRAVLCSSSWLTRNPGGADVQGGA